MRDILVHISLYLPKSCLTGPLAFIAIGHTASAIESDIKPFLESIMSHIKTGLQNRGCVVQLSVRAPHSTSDRRKNTISEEPIFQCIGMLVAAVGPHLTKLLHSCCMINWISCLLPVLASLCVRRFRLSFTRSRLSWARSKVSTTLRCAFPHSLLFQISCWIHERTAVQTTRSPLQFDPKRELHVEPGVDCSGLCSLAGS